MKLFTRAICVFALCFLIYCWLRRLSRPTIKCATDLNQTNRLTHKHNRTQLRARRIFISHSWHLSSREYNSLLKNLRSMRLIYNHSIPRRKARRFKSKQDLYNIFRRQMAWCSKVFVLADKAIPFDSYVIAEMDIAAELGKEIIAIQPDPSYPIPHFIRRRVHHIIMNDAHEIKRVLG